MIVGPHYCSFRNIEPLQFTLLEIAERPQRKQYLILGDVLQPL